MIKIKKIKTKFDNPEHTKTIKLKGYRYDLDIFEIRILIIIGEKSIIKHNNLFGRGGCEAKCCDYLKPHREINMFFKDNPSMNTIVHECTHACDFIFKFLHHKHPNNANELNANLTAHLVDIVLEAKKKHDKESKK
jgi:hypothetical protein